MGISGIRSTAPKNIEDLEQTIRKQERQIENLTREIYRINAEKSVCDESVMSFSDQLQKLIENYGSLNDKYQILNLIVNQMNAVFLLLKFNGKNKYELAWANNQYSNLVSKHMKLDSQLESGVQLSQLISAKDEEIISSSYDFFVENPTKTFNTIYNSIEKDGKNIWLLINSVASKINSRGEPVEVIALILDITDRIEAEERIKKLEKENTRLRARMKKLNLRNTAELVNFATAHNIN